MECIIIKDEPAETTKYLHIHSPVNTVMTLCGWVDVSYELKEGKPTCPECLEVVKYCKSLKVRLK